MSITVCLEYFAFNQPFCFRFPLALWFSNEGKQRQDHFEQQARSNLQTTDTEICCFQIKLIIINPNLSLTLPLKENLRHYLLYEPFPQLRVSL